MKQTILMTGGDAGFFPFLHDALRSWADLGLDRKAEIGILDLGLKPEQRGILQAMGCQLRLPEWTLPVPESRRTPHYIGNVARTALRELFPGHSIYLWFDADAWAQTDEFFAAFIDGARAQGAAAARENGPGYRRDWVYSRWWYGHMIASYGLFDGVRIARRPAINNGILALADTAPHWDAWARHYRAMITERGFMNNQHSLNAAIAIEQLPTALLPARCNWICTLSPPAWDPHRRLLCEPGAAFAPLSVIHLAGSNKKRAYKLRSLDGFPTSTTLTYPAKSEQNRKASAARITSSPLVSNESLQYPLH